MDGAVITDGAAEVIYRANVHLIPDPSIATSETGTRHRTAERVAIQTGRRCRREPGETERHGLRRCATV